MSNEMKHSKRREGNFIEDACNIIPYIKDEINTRTSEVLSGGDWIKINPINIKKDMTFRMFEDTGEPILGLNDTTSWIATSDAYYNEGGVVTIDIDCGKE